MLIYKIHGKDLVTFSWPRQMGFLDGDPLPQSQIQKKYVTAWAENYYGQIFPCFNKNFEVFLPSKLSKI